MVGGGLNTYFFVVVCLSFQQAHKFFVTTILMKRVLFSVDSVGCAYAEICFFVHFINC